MHHFLKIRNVELSLSENEDIKCALVERVIRTLKSRLFRLFKHQDNTVHIKKIGDLVKLYNASSHSCMECAKLTCIKATH